MLQSYYGHWFNETVGFVAAARSAGMDMKVYAARDVDSAVARQTDARGVYALTRDMMKRYGVPSRYAREKSDPHCQDLIDFMAWSEAFRQACEEVGQDGIGQDDLLVVPFATINEMHGAALWLETLPAERRPGAVFNFHEPHPTWRIEDNRNGMEGDLVLSRYAGLRLRSALPEHRILVTAPDRRLCVALREGLGLACRRTPMLMHYESEFPDDLPGTDTRLTVSVVGDFRAERGSKLVLEALRDFATQRPETRFFVQVQTEAQASELLESLRRDVPGVQLECQAGSVSRENYLRRLRQSDLILLPYFWRRYAIRGSGVFCEATAFGIPVVAPANTWMADHLEAGRGAGETFSDWTSGAIAAALVRASDRIDELKAQAASGSAAWRDEESVHAYLPAIIGWWESRAQRASATPSPPPRPQSG